MYIYIYTHIYKTRLVTGGAPPCMESFNWLDPILCFELYPR